MIASGKVYGFERVLEGFPMKLKKIVAAKMRASGRPASHYSKTTGKLLKKYQQVLKRKSPV